MIRIINLKSGFLRMVAPFLGFCESIVTSKKNKMQFPPVFIIGAPRSGTTLLYQLLVHTFRFSYFSNSSLLLKNAPVCLTALLKPFHGNYKSDFSSRYGITNGASAPHEAGPVWNRWFPDERHFFNCETLPENHRMQIYATVAAMEKVYNAPFINKNVKHSVRIKAIKNIFPDAVFLVMHRNPTDTAISILRVRHDNMTNVNCWWSVMPRQIDEIINLHYLDQIAAQVYYVYENINRDLELCGPKDFIKVDYERLCLNTGKELNNVTKFLHSKGIPLAPNNYDWPLSFPVKKARPGPPDEEAAKLALKVKNIFNQGR